MLLYFLMQDVPSRKYAIVLLHAWSTVEEVCYFTDSCRMYPWRKYAILLTHAGCTHGGSMLLYLLMQDVPMRKYPS